jgi:antitoxin MazE
MLGWIRKIGKSKSIILPEAICERYCISDKLEVILEEKQFILRPIAAPRSGWDEAFKWMHSNGDDQLLIDDFFENENIILR